MASCRNCGAELISGAEFCMECAKEDEETRPLREEMLRLYEALQNCEDVRSGNVDSFMERIQSILKRCRRKKAKNFMNWTVSKYFSSSLGSWDNSRNVRYKTQKVGQI